MPNSYQIPSPAPGPVSNFKIGQLQIIRGRRTTNAQGLCFSLSQVRDFNANAHASQATKPLSEGRVLWQQLPTQHIAASEVASEGVRHSSVADFNPKSALLVPPSLTETVRIVVSESLYSSGI
jgi:hypothetical protein